MSETFPPLSGDFNDLADVAGLDAVREQIHAAVPALPEADPLAAAPRLMRDRVILTCGSDLTPEPIRWLWQDWIAKSKFHLIAGAPGQGKTTLAISMAATVTIGGRWPDGSRCEAANALIWSGEDDPADTLLPRLIAAGADRSKCFFISGAQRDGEVVPFDPARDMGQLLAAIESIGGVGLLIVDPVVSAVAGEARCDI